MDNTNLDKKRPWPFAAQTNIADTNPEGIKEPPAKKQKVKNLSSEQMNRMTKKFEGREILDSEDLDEEGVVSETSAHATEHPDTTAAVPVLHEDVLPSDPAALADSEDETNYTSDLSDLDIGKPTLVPSKNSVEVESIKQTLNTAILNRDSRFDSATATNVPAEDTAATNIVAQPSAMPTPDADDETRDNQAAGKGLEDAIEADYDDYYAEEDECEDDKNLDHQYGIFHELGVVTSSKPVYVTAQGVYMINKPAVCSCESAHDSDKDPNARYEDIGIDRKYFHHDYFLQYHGLASGYDDPPNDAAAEAA